MKNSIALKFLLFMLILGITSSCGLFDDDDDPEIIDEYLVSYKLVRSYHQDGINLFIENFIDDYPELEPIRDHVKNGVLVYTISYNTTFDNEPVIASGLVCVPVGEGPFPVMSYQNGTNTLHSNAPSVNPDNDLYRLLQLTSSTGFIISMPDYIGFGESADMSHPYLHAESTVQSVLDMLRAVKELNENYLETAATDELYLAGYSQGGWATIQVQKAIEENHTDEFNLKASAAGAGPYDLTFINDFIVTQSTYPMPYFLAYMLDSYIDLNLINVSADDVFQEPYSSKIGSMFDGTKTGEELNAELTTSVPDLFTTSYLENYATDDDYQSLREALQANSIDAWNTTTPTMLIHGTDDQFVPIQVSQNLYQGFLSEGVSEDNIILVPLPGTDHAGGIIPSGLLSVQWFLEMEQ